MSKANKTQSILPRMGDFYPRLFQSAWLGFALAQFVTALVTVGGAMLLVPHIGMDDFVFIMIFWLVVAESIIGYVFLKIVLYPTDMLARALIQLGDEKSTLPPPNRNDPKVVKIGLKPLLDEIYDLAEKAKRCEQQTLSVNERLLRSLLGALPVGFIAMDAHHNIIASNELAPTYYPQKDRQAVQLDFTDVADSLSIWLRDVEKNAVEAEKLWTRIQNVPPGQDGRKIYDVMVHYKKNAPSGIETFIVTVDRTEEYLENESNMDFIALAAHELRGPITVIRGYLDILDEQMASQLSSEQHELIDRLNVSANRLSAYVNNILNVSRYDRRHLQLKLTETRVDDIIGDIRDDMELRARTLDRHLNFNVPHELPTVAADRSSISEVLSNLIDNAIKYSHDGGQIEVGAAIDGDFVEISVRDHGIGIPAVVAQHLFSKFYRSHRSRGAVSGSGLGLYISRAIVESHGGHISVESREDEGSTFTFTLPIFSTVAGQLATSDGSNTELIRDGGNWIRNHGTIKD